jgi:hypothetical protein
VRLGRSWPAIVEHGRGIVEASSYPLTLRGLHYKLLDSFGYRNTKRDYDRLSELTAKARRHGAFPTLAEDVRRIERLSGWGTPQEALDWLVDQYVRDRTDGQEAIIWFAIEKRTLVPLLRARFEPWGMPLIALGGYASQTLCDRVRDAVDTDGRPAVLLIASDFDPSGEDLVRDFVARTDCWKHVERVALTWEQVVAYDLPPALGKATDSRAAAFFARHGQLVQVELDALDPGELLRLYEDAARRWWDEEAFAEVLREEADDRQWLERLREEGEAR